MSLAPVASSSAELPTVPAATPASAFQNLIADMIALPAAQTTPLVPATHSASPPCKPLAAVGVPGISGHAETPVPADAAKTIPVTPLPAGVAGEMPSVIIKAPVVLMSTASAAASDEDNDTDIVTPDIAVLPDVSVATVATPLQIVSAVDSHMPQTKGADALPSLAGLDLRSPQLPPGVAEPFTPTGPAQPVPSLLMPVVIAPYAAASGHLDLASGALWLDQLAQEILVAIPNDGRLRFTLSPQNLGDLQVAIGTSADGINVQMQASTDSAARILASEQHRLAEALRQSGIKLVGCDLFTGGHMHSSQDQSRTHDPARQVPFRVSGSSFLDAQPARAPTTRLEGRFA